MYCFRNFFNPHGFYADRLDRLDRLGGGHWRPSRNDRSTLGGTASLLPRIEPSVLVTGIMGIWVGGRPVVVLKEMI